MKDDFFKFPTTPHLTILGDIQIRDDKVMTESERNEFIQHEIIVEEKVDGANLGISFDIEGNVRVQNRGAYLQLQGGGQWKKLKDWLAPRTETLFEQLTDRYILFGEWCYAQHSIFYNLLPDWFLGFDVYERSTTRFYSCMARDKIFQKLGISQVPKIGCGRFSFPELKRLLSKSRFGDDPAEGLYLRLDKGDYLVQRAKLVRPAFIQTVEQHWSRSGIKPNRLAMDVRS
ncbi:MAG TPA: RNA ligase family protein [Smithellaceae bacterium]|nr:RNA ligase family protein [Smithellaceae bacterium]